MSLVGNRRGIVRVAADQTGKGVANVETVNAADYAQLGGNLTQGATIVAVAVAGAAGLLDALASGDIITVSDGTTNAEAFTVGPAGAPVGSTSIPVVSQVAAFGHTAGDIISIPVTLQNQNTVDTDASGIILADAMVRFDYGSRTDSFPIYVGLGPEGADPTSTTATNWTIFKLTWDGSNRLTAKDVATRSAWASRATVLP